MLTMHKTAAGTRWLAISSTAHRDRDSEIISTKALRNAVEHADPDFLGPLRFWHEPLIDLGTCDFQTITDDGKFLIESGLILDENIASSMIEAMQVSEWEMSIGFFHHISEPDINNVYHDILIYERSILPAGTAGNGLTRFSMGD